MAVKSLYDGTSIISVSGNRVSPIFDATRLRLVFLLPKVYEREDLRRWRRTVNRWNHVHTG
jgi:hypothetical protein